MRKVEIGDYAVKANGQEVPYGVRDSIADLLFHPDLRLNGSALIRNNVLATKVMTAEGDTVLLEEAEYQTLRGACETVRGLGRNEVELVRRILDAPEVKVEEAICQSEG
jgi:hypothetical protein